MKKIITFTVLLLVFSFIQTIQAQDKPNPKIEILEKQKEQIESEEKTALKKEIMRINRLLEEEEIGETQAKLLKEDAAKKHALNIQNRLAIVDHKLALLKRNGSIPNNKIDFDDESFTIRIGKKRFDFEDNMSRRYDRRTYDELIFAFGLNNAIISGQSLDDSPYQIGGSRFFEIGWAWRTRVFKNTNFLRIHYGLSFQFNGLKAKDNQYFVNNDGQTELQEFDHDLKKAKLRMDNLVIPIHFEFGPSKLRKNENNIRYRIHNQFRLGLGGYAGLNLGTRQKLKYSVDGNKVKDKLKRGYNTSNLVYGLSAYAGFGDVLLYAKYDLSPIFKDATVEQRNISLGLRFDL